MNLSNLTILGMEGDLPFQFWNLLFLIPPVLKAVYDTVFTANKNIPVNHKHSLGYALMLGGPLAGVDWLCSPVTYLAQSIFLGIATFWFVFDPLRNYLAGKDLLYMDIVDTDPNVEDSWLDSQVYSKLPSGFAWLFIKFWFLVLAFNIYYFFSYI